MVFKRKKKLKKTVNNSKNKVTLFLFYFIGRDFAAKGFVKRWNQFFDNFEWKICQQGY